MDTSPAAGLPLRGHESLVPNRPRLESILLLVKVFALAAVAPSRGDGGIYWGRGLSPLLLHILQDVLGFSGELMTKVISIPILSSQNISGMLKFIKFFMK